MAHAHTTAVYIEDDKPLHYSPAGDIMTGYHVSDAGRAAIENGRYR